MIATVGIGQRQALRMMALVVTLASVGATGLASAQSRPPPKNTDRLIIDDDPVPTVDDLGGDDAPPSKAQAARKPNSPQGDDLKPDPYSTPPPAPPSATPPAPVPPKATPPPVPTRRPVVPGGVAIPAPDKRPRPLTFPPPTKPAEIVTEEDLRSQVERMVEAYRAGDKQRFQLERTELEALKIRAGVRNVVLASAMLIRQAQSALTANLPEAANEFAEAAVRLSPDVTAAHWTRVRVMWVSDWTRLRPIVGAIGGWLSAQFTVFRNQVALLTTVFMIIGLAALLTFVVFAAIQTLKYIRYPAFDLAHQLPSFIGAGEMVIVLLLLIVLPVAFGAGPAISGLVALLVVTGYQLPAERLVARTMMVALAFVPLALFACAPLVVFHGSLVDDMATATSEAFAKNAEARLSAATTNRSRDTTSALILARRKRLRGDLPGADMAYERALVLRPGDPIALNNRGVVQFLLGHHEAASSLFQRGANAGRAESALNLATLRAEAGRFEEATRLLEQARRLDAQLASTYSGLDGSQDSSKRLFEADMGTSRLWGRLLDVDAESSWAVAESLWRRVASSVPLWTIAPMALLALMVSVVLSMRTERLSMACSKCGTPADRRAYGKLCDQCTSVFLTAVAVDPQLRANKENEVRAYQRRRRWMERLTSLVAGIGQLVAGRAWSGALFLFLLAVSLLTWTFREGLFINDWRLVFDGSYAAFVGAVALIVALVLCVVSFQQSTER